MGKYLLPRNEYKHSVVLVQNSSWERCLAKGGGRIFTHTLDHSETATVIRRSIISQRANHLRLKQLSNVPGVARNTQHYVMVHALNWYSIELFIEAISNLPWTAGAWSSVFPNATEILSLTVILKSSCHTFATTGRGSWVSCPCMRCLHFTIECFVLCTTSAPNLLFDAWLWTLLRAILSCSTAQYNCSSKDELALGHLSYDNTLLTTLYIVYNIVSSNEKVSLY